MPLTATVRSSADTLRQEILVNGHHRLVTDEPESLGGTDTAPTPHELLPAALAACVATTIRMFARRQGWSLQEIIVEATLDTRPRPQRCTITVALPSGLEEGQWRRLEYVARACVVHRTLEQGVDFEQIIELPTSARPVSAVTIPTIHRSGSSLERIARRPKPQRIPRPVDGQPGLFVVDGTWGTIAPISLAPGVRTIGELEVLDHLRAGGPCIDCRQRAYYTLGTLAGAISIPHQDIDARRHELDPRRPTVVFCNGPQCTATPQAVTALLATGHPAEALLYYRGGIHDWVTLGLPLHQP